MASMSLVVCSPLSTSAAESDAPRSLDALIAEVLGIPEGAIHDELGYRTIPEWDSVAQVELLTALEETYRIPVLAEDGDALGTVGAIRTWLNRMNVPVESSVVIQRQRPVEKEAPTVHRGLDGVYFDRSRITSIDGAAGKLQYRGYSIAALTANASFEETTYLLVHGTLPTAAQLGELDATLRAARTLPDAIIELLRGMRGAHAMDAVRTAVSALAAFDEDRFDDGPEAVLRKGTRLVAQVPTVVAAFHALRNGREPIAPRGDLGHAANLFYMLTGREPTEREIDVIEQDLVLHADHGANASTFTARIVTGARGDFHAAITAAIATFSGKLHGGALEQAMGMVRDIGEASRAPAYIRERRAKKQPIMGFGHRVYRVEDPRAIELRAICRELSIELGDTRWFDILEAVVEEMRPQAAHGLVVNVDFYAAVIYQLLGFPDDLAVALFVVGRSSGWLAHVLEQLGDNVLIRPRLDYRGPLDLSYVPVEERAD